MNGLTSTDLALLSKLLGMVGSDHDGEALAAARKADALVRGGGLRLYAGSPTHFISKARRYGPIVLLVAAILIWPNSPASAQQNMHEYVTLQTDKEGVYFYHVPSLVQTDNGWRVWTLYNLIGKEISQAAGAKSVMILFEGDCAKQQVRQLTYYTFSDFDGAGSGLKKDLHTQSDKWSYPVPGTAPAIMLKAFCR